MRLLLSVVAVAVAALTATADEPKKDDQMKKHELKVSFATPNPSWKATISEVRVVGKELWVKVDVASAGGIAPQVIGKAEATATVEAAGLPVKYAVFGKSWGWKNEEKDLTFAKDLSKDDLEKWEKAWKDGKVVFEAKKKDEKKNK